MEELEAQILVLVLSCGNMEHHFGYLGFSYLYNEIIDLLMYQTFVSDIMTINRISAG
jgi:hypothetical protein